MTLNIFDKNNNLQGTYTTDVKVVGTTFLTPLVIGSAGDSLTNRKPWINDVVSLSGSQISFTGTRTLSGDATGTLGHEGRSGATSGYYLGNNSYTFDSNGIQGNDGRTQDLNPYWNPNTSDVDYSYYLSNYNKPVPDVLLIWLGTNGIAVDPTTNAGNIKTFIDKIRLTGAAGIPVYVVHTLFRPDQNGIGEQGAVDGFNPNMASYKLEEDLKVINLAIELKTILDGYSELYFVPVAQTLDSEYNFGQVPTLVNPYSTVTVDYPTDATHPQDSGYSQAADTIFSSLAARHGSLTDLNSCKTTYNIATDNETLTLPIGTNSIRSFIDWGDGNSWQYYDIGSTTSNVYDVSGTYEVRIKPDVNTGLGDTLPNFSFNDGGDKDKIISIDQWGTYKFTPNSMQKMFRGCSNLVYNTTDIPLMDNQSNWQFMYRDAPLCDPSFTGFDFSTGTGSNYIATMIFNTSISIANYDELLILLDSQVLALPASMNNSGATYTLGGAAETARTSLIGKGLSITGDSGV